MMNIFYIHRVFFQSFSTGSGRFMKISPFNSGRCEDG